MTKLYKREDYLKQIRGFYDDAEIIKVITGIRRCGKSCFLDTIINELLQKKINKKDIIVIKLDSKPYKHLKEPQDLEKAIDEKITDKSFKYLFLDEVQNVSGFEEVIESYRIEGKMSIFITGSNSYLLSGELVTKLSGRKIEIEMLPLNFYEYLEMKKLLNKNIDNNYYIEFRKYIRYGGFPKALQYNNEEDALKYTQSILNDIFEKDIKNNVKIKNKDLFDNILTFVINNFASNISASSIKAYYKSQNINIDIRTINKYLTVLENAKIIYPCQNFDLKSKKILSSSKKYYLADLSIYFAFNTDNRINYGPVLENILFNYLKVKGYYLSVGRIGKLECDFIARKNIEDYFYIQVSKNIDDEKTYEREYKPFYMIKDLYPRYLFVLDFVIQDNVDGIKNVNIVDFIANNSNLI